MALLGRSGAAVVEILETGAVLVGRVCGNSAKALAVFSVHEWSCRALSLFHPSVTLLFLHQLLLLLLWAALHACVCVLVCMCGEQVCRVSFVCWGMG